MVYRDGGKYEGLWEKGMRHGVGTMSYVTLSGTPDYTYKGNWVSDQKSGEGKSTWKNSSYGG